jgi:hypothetical protein
VVEAVEAVAVVVEAVAVVEVAVLSQAARRPRWRDTRQQRAATGDDSLCEVVSCTGVHYAHDLQFH